MVQAHIKKIRTWTKNSPLLFLYDEPSPGIGMVVSTKRKLPAFRVAVHTAAEQDL
jgi:hypothetical protein